VACHRRAANSPANTVGREGPATFANERHPGGVVADRLQLWISRLGLA
jgi:hypothetical protein